MTLLPIAIGLLAPLTSFDLATLSETRNSLSFESPISRVTFTPEPTTLIIMEPTVISGYCNCPGLPVGIIEGSSTLAKGYNFPVPYTMLYSKTYTWSKTPDAGTCIEEYKVTATAQPLMPGYSWKAYGDAVVTVLRTGPCPTQTGGGEQGGS